MNKVILLGRLTRDPEVRYSQGEPPVGVTRFGIAVNKRSKRDVEPDADFFNCTAFGKTGEVINKYFKKGQQILICGSIKNNSWTDSNNRKRISTEIIVEEAHFTGSKKDNEQNTNNSGSGFYQAEPVDDEENLPF